MTTAYERKVQEVEKIVCVNMSGCSIPQTHEMIEDMIAHMKELALALLDEQISETEGMLIEVSRHYSAQPVKTPNHADTFNNAINMVLARLRERRDLIAKTNK